MEKLELLIDKLKDDRSKKVIFVSHCLLNVNTRYLGGAFRRGSLNEIIIELMEKDIGIVQIKCPEQYAWGGILKKIMWIPFDSKKSIIYFLRRLLVPAFIFYTRMIYRKIAVSLVAEINDYIKHGFTVAGIIGVDGSPSCGVNLKLDIKKSFEFYASNNITDLEKKSFNYALYNKCLENEDGIFINEVKRQLKKRGIQIPLFAHSLINEMNGEKSNIIL